MQKVEFYHQKRQLCSGHSAKSGEYRCKVGNIVASGGVLPSVRMDTRVGTIVATVGTTVARVGTTVATVGTTVARTPLSALLP